MNEKKKILIKMGVLDSNKSSNISSSSPSALHVWKKFKKDKLEDPQKFETDERLSKPVNERRLASDNTHNSSCSSQEFLAKRNNYKIIISRRSVVQEKLFSAQLNQHKKQTHESSYSTDSSFDSSVDRRRGYLRPDDHYNKENNGSVNVTGVLHLKKPLSVNSDNEKKYYEDRGRMEPINWNNHQSNGEVKKLEIKRKPEVPKETAALLKPRVSDEFSNFVKKSVPPKIAYNTQGNIEKNVNAIDCPIFNIQEIIKKKRLGTIRIPAAVRQSFLELRPGFHLFNKIDTFKVIDPEKRVNPKSKETARQEEKHISKDRNLLNQNSHHNQYNKNLKKHELLLNAVKPRLDRNEARTIGNTDTQNFDCVTGEKEATCNLVQNKTDEKRGKETKKRCATHGCDDYDMVSYVNSLSPKENVAKRESRKQGLEVDDDLFDFVQNPSEPCSIISNPPAPPANKSYDRFNRIKALCREKEKNNKTIDSDDTFNVSSDLESISVSVVSTHDRFRAFRKKMVASTSLCKQSENAPVTLPDENDDSKMLENKNQLLNRCLRAAHDFQKVHEDNVIEITNVKVGPKPEELLKPISTRYFPKSSADRNALSSSKEVDKSESNSTPIKTLQEEKKEKSNVDYNVTNNASINKISSIVTSSVDSKTDFECESNDKLHMKIGDKDREIDSGLCMKSIENSLVTNDLSVTKFDSEMSNNYNVLSLVELAESTNISGNVISDIQSENQYSTKSEVTCKNDTKLKITKDQSKFDVVSSDSDNEMMDCEDFIDYEAFDVENIDMWFPQLNGKVKNIKQAVSNVMPNDNNNGMLSLTEYPYDSKNQSSGSDFENSNNHDSSNDASISLNLNTDSENSSSPSSLFNFGSCFDKLDINVSDLKTSGLHYNDNKTTKIDSTNQKDPKKNQNVNLDLRPINSQGNPCSTDSSVNSASQEKLCNSKNAGKENVEQVLNNNNDAPPLQRSVEVKHSDVNVTSTPKPVSKKIQKYRNTLKNYKDKAKTGADAKKDNEIVQQSDKASRNDNSPVHESRPQIMREIQKHKLRLTFKPLV